MVRKVKRNTKKLVTKKKVAKKKVTRTMKVLPKVMSKLIGIALADMRKAEAMRDKYILDLNVWHQPVDVECRVRNGGGDDVYAAPIHSHKACIMCAAGSVMEFTLGANKSDVIKELSPDNFKKNTMQLEAINCLREGDVRAAAGFLGLTSGNRWDPKKSMYVPYSKKGQKPADFFSDFNDYEMPPYERDNPEPFHKAMTKLQRKLERAGY